MCITVSRPYFAPFGGFFYRAFHADVLVVLDRVQLPLGTSWITRNRFKNDQGAVWLTVPVWKKHLGRQRIDQVRICHQGRRARKHLRLLDHAYANAPYYEDHRPFLEKCLDIGWEKIIDLNLEILNYVMPALRLNTKIVLQSELGVDATGGRLLIEICRTLAADGLLAQTPSRKYLDPQSFDAAGLTLQFLQIPAIVYPQLWGDFIANLSVFDLLLNCGPKSRDIICGHPPKIAAGYL